MVQGKRGSRLQGAVTNQLMHAALPHPSMHHSTGSRGCSCFPPCSKELVAPAEYLVPRPSPLLGAECWCHRSPPRVDRPCTSTLANSTY